MQELEFRSAWQDEQIDFLEQRLKDATDEINWLERGILLALFAGIAVGLLAGVYGV